MTTQYNIVTHGNLVNNNGILSVFSISNYATLPLEFNPTLSHYDIVFKFNTADISEEQGLFAVYNANNYTFPVLTIEIYDSALYFEITSGEIQYNEITGSTILSPNTEYWVKINRNNDIYTLYLSTNGTTWTTEGTFTTSSNPPLDNYISIIGLLHTNIEGFKCPLMGSIDLNESYIDINNTRWWQGVTSTSDVITRIQLRHDTAANWVSVNPILLEGEVGLELDTRKQKVGDGVTAWNSLPYDTGSTALQSITSTNVTNALGYTPVNKTGDTMTGGLSIDTDDNNRRACRIDNISTTAERDIEFNATSASHRVGVIRAGMSSDGTTCVMTFGSCNPNNDPPRGLIISRTNSNISCSFPNTTCCDGQWVYKDKDLTSSATSLNGSTSLSYTLSDIPNDGYKYEALISFWGSTGSTSGNAIEIRVQSDNIQRDIYVCRAVTRTASSASCAGNVIIPLTSSRKVYVTRATGWNGTFEARMLGYRRIGTNS